MQPAHFRSTAPINADVAPSVLASNLLFPNASRFAPIFAGLEAPPDDASNPDAAFFSAFASNLVDSARRLTAPSADVLFDRCGFSTPDVLARSLADVSPIPSQALLFADVRDARFLVAAPISTFRLLFDAALGFDVAALCANEAFYADFNADARQPLTPFEEEAFAPEFARFASLSPLATEQASVLATSRTTEQASAPFSPDSIPPLDAWRPVSSLLPTSRAAFALDAPLLYWERRSIRLAERFFPWTVVFSTRFLASLTRESLVREPSRPTSAPPSPRSLYPSRSARPSYSTHSPLPSQPSPFTYFSDASYPAYSSSSSDLPCSAADGDASKTSFDLSIVVEQGQMSAESWRRLQPGDVLTTNVPANALFLGLVDGVPRFLCRPGLYRGAAAVQIKGEAGDDRE